MYPFVRIELPKIENINELNITLIRDNIRQHFRIKLFFEQNFVNIREILENIVDIQNNSFRDSDVILVENLVIVLTNDSKIMNIYTKNIPINIKNISEAFYVYEFDSGLENHVFVEIQSKSRGFESQTFRNPILMSLNDVNPEQIDDNFKRNLPEIYTQLIPMNNIYIHLKTFGNFHVYRTEIYISLLSPSNVQSLQMSSFELRFNKYIKSKPLDDDNQMYCSICQKQTVPIEKWDLLEAPNILQFKTNFINRYSKQISTDFPLNLNIA